MALYQRLVQNFTFNSVNGHHCTLLITYSFRVFLGHELGLGGIGLLVVIVIVLPIAMPMSGYVSAQIGYKLTQNHEIGWKKNVHIFVGYSIIPILIFSIYTGGMQYGPNRIKRANNFKLQARYVIKHGSDYFSLPCRLEFGVRNHPDSCTMAPDTSNLDLKAMKIPRKHRASTFGAI